MADFILRRSKKKSSARVYRPSSIPIKIIDSSWDFTIFIIFFRTSFRFLFENRYFHSVPPFFFLGLFCHFISYLIKNYGLITRERRLRMWIGCTPFTDKVNEEPRDDVNKRSVPLPASDAEILTWMQVRNLL